MVRLRRMLERGRRHPVLGPILVVLLVLLLAMTWLHAAHEGWDGAIDLGVVCVVLASIVVGLVLGRLVTFVPGLAAHTRADRGPPYGIYVRVARSPRLARLQLVLPLRR